MVCAQKQGSKEIGSRQAIADLSDERAQLIDSSAHKHGIRMTDLNSLFTNVGESSDSWKVGTSIVPQQ